jgi:hypothetical protein
MRKYLLTYLLILILSSNSFCQSCLPDGITFDAQEEINSFQSDYPGCTSIEGNVIIKGDDINDLNGLNVITSIGGMLRFYSLTDLETMEGLENLTNVGGDLDIYTWPGVTTSLTSLKGLENIATIGGDLSITGNDKITSLSGLSGLVSIPGDVSIAANQSLESCSGLNNLQSVGGDCWIGENPLLESLEGLGKLQSVGGILEFYDNDALLNLNGLSGLESVGSSLKIGYCDVLTSLSGLESLGTINDGYLEIYDNPNLTCIDSLMYLQASSIGGLYIGSNTSLSECAILPVCNYIADPAGSLTITDNADGCNSTTEVDDACNISATGAKRLLPEISIYPNPARAFEVIKIHTVSHPTYVQVYSLSGKILHDFTVKTETNELTIQGYPSGLYIIETGTDQGSHFSKLIIK